MFISRSTYEAMIRENARLASSCDWLSQLVNTLQQERAVLLSRILEVQVPVMEIARETAPERPADYLTPEKLKALELSFVPNPQPGRRVSQRKPETNLVEAEAASAMAIFEDMGDEAAARSGVNWTDDGELAYTAGTR